MMCYHCGILGNVEKECPSKEEEGEEEGKINFGSWLKASPLKKGRAMQNREREKEKQWMATMQEREKKKRHEGTNKSDVVRALKFNETKRADFAYTDHGTDGQHSRVGEEKVSISLSQTLL